MDTSTPQKKLQSKGGDSLPLQTWSTIDRSRPSDKDLEDAASVLVRANNTVSPITPAEVVLAAKIRIGLGTCEQSSDPDQLLSLVRGREITGEDDAASIRADTKESVQAALAANREVKKSEKMKKVMGLLVGMQTVNPSQACESEFGVNLGCFRYGDPHPFFQFGEELEWPALAEKMREREIDFKIKLEEALRKGERLSPYEQRTYAREMGNWGNWGSRGGDSYQTGLWQVPSLGIIPPGLLEDAFLQQKKCQELVATIAIAKFEQLLATAKESAEQICKTIPTLSIKDVRFDMISLWLAHGCSSHQLYKRYFPELLKELGVKPLGQASRGWYINLTIPQAQQVLGMAKASLEVGRERGESGAVQSSIGQSDSQAEVISSGAGHKSEIIGRSEQELSSTIPIAEVNQPATADQIQSLLSKFGGPAQKKKT